MGRKKDSKKPVPQAPPESKKTKTKARGTPERPMSGAQDALPGHKLQSSTSLLNIPCLRSKSPDNDPIRQYTRAGRHDPFQGLNVIKPVTGYAVPWTPSGRDSPSHYSVHSNNPEGPCTPSVPHNVFPCPVHLFRRRDSLRGAQSTNDISDMRDLSNSFVPPSSPASIASSYITLVAPPDDSSESFFSDATIPSQSVLVDRCLPDLLPLPQVRNRRRNARSRSSEPSTSHKSTYVGPNDLIYSPPFAFSNKISDSMGYFTTITRSGDTSSNSDLLSPPPAFSTHTRGVPHGSRQPRIKSSKRSTTATTSAKPGVILNTQSGLPVYGSGTAEHPSPSGSESAFADSEMS